MKIEKANYETVIVAMLSLLWAVVILNRIVIVFLFPFIIDEFKINYTQAGALTSILAVAFAVSTWLFGGLSDRFGKKIVLLPTTILFSVMSCLSGLTQNFYQMLLARGFLGISQGGTLAPSVATISAESTPSRRGFNFGLHQASAYLIALGIGPIIVTQASTILSWRSQFVVVGIPGLLISAVLYFYMREPVSAAIQDRAVKSQSSQKDKITFWTPLKYRNVLVSSIIVPILLCTQFVFMAFSLVYLTKEVKLSISTAGMIISLMGFAGFAGCILLPMLSDYLGRKKVLIPSLFVVGLSLWNFVVAGNDVVFLALSVSVSGFAMAGIGPIAISALTTESVPAHLAGTSAAIPVSIGEIMGGALMPFVAGLISDLYGLKAAILLSAVAPVIGTVVAFCYTETAPRVLKKQLSSAPHREL